MIYKLYNKKEERYESGDTNKHQCYDTIAGIKTYLRVTRNHIDRCSWAKEHFNIDNYEIHVYSHTSTQENIKI